MCAMCPGVRACVCVRLRFGCSLSGDTHTAAFDTAGGSEEVERERERKEKTQGKERRQEKNTRRRDDVVFVCS